MKTSLIIAAGFIAVAGSASAWEGTAKACYGKVWSPDRDKTYSGKLVLSGNSLNVKGCVFGVCRSGGKWKRVN